jgi:hypothetical protein
VKPLDALSLSGPFEPELEHAAVRATAAVTRAADARREREKGFMTNRPSFEDRLRGVEQASGLAFPGLEALGAAVPLRDSAGFSPVFAASAPSRDGSRDALNLAARARSGDRSTAGAR